jgi:D-ribose pyranase
MLKTGILNPDLASLIARVRHTNTLVIADRGFPFWPEMETIDISLVDGIPTVLDVLRALRPNFIIGRAWMADEFRRGNTEEVQRQFSTAMDGVSIEYEPHEELKNRVYDAIGIIRTGDTIQYANIIIESA